MLLVLTFILLCWTKYTVSVNERKLVKSLIAVPNEGRGDVTIINSETETFENINIETGSPSYVIASRLRNEFYVRDHETVYIYNSITLERIGVINNTNCHGIMWSYYNEYMHQLWNMCDEDSKFVVIDTENKEIVTTVAVDFEPHAVVTLHDVALITGIIRNHRHHKSAIIVKYSTETFNEINRETIGNGNCGDPHLFYDNTELNANYNHYVYSTCQNINMVYKIDTNNLNTIQTLEISGAHGIWGRGNHFYIGNAPGWKSSSNEGKIGIIHLINVYDNMEDVEMFNNSVIGHIHNLIINCEGNKLFIAHSWVANAVSVFDIGDNGELIGRNRIIYLDNSSSPMSFDKICVYQNNLSISVISGYKYHDSNIHFNNQVYNFMINVIISAITYGYWWTIVVPFVLLVCIIQYFTQK